MSNKIDFGGNSAFAISKGFTANFDPEVFKIMGDKLYLCVDQEVLQDWPKDRDMSRKKSEEDWNG